MRMDDILSIQGIYALKSYYADKFLTPPADFDISDFEVEFGCCYGSFFSEVYYMHWSGELQPRPPYVDSPVDLPAFFETLKNCPLDSSTVITTTQVCDPDHGILKSTIAITQLQNLENWKRECRERCKLSLPQPSCSFIAFCPTTSSFWTLLNHPPGSDWPTVAAERESGCVKMVDNPIATEMEGAVDMDHRSYMDLFLTKICPSMSQQDLQSEYFIISE
jgi:hypothetical protein